MTSPAALFGVLLLGLIWGAETIIGKSLLQRGFAVFDFPLLLNGVTVALVVMSCLISKQVRAQVIAINDGRGVYLLLTAFFLVALPYFLIYSSLAMLSPAVISLYSSMTSVFSLLIFCLCRRVRPKLNALAGIVLCLLGVLLLLGGPLVSGSMPAQSVQYLILLLIPMSYAIAGYLIQQLSRYTTGYFQLLGVTNLVPFLMFMILSGGVSSIDLDGDGLLLALGITLNCVAISLMYYLASRVSPVLLSFSNYAVVGFSFLLACLFLSERWQWNVGLAVALVVIGTLLMKDKEQLQ